MFVLRADRSVVNLRPRNSILESVSFYELHFMSCNMIDLIEVNVCIRTTAVTSLKCLYTGYCFHSGVVADGVELTVDSANYITDSWSHRQQLSLLSLCSNTVFVCYSSL
jgi:hypothetical protein